MTTLEPRPRQGGAERAGTPLPRVDPITKLPILILFPHSRCNCRCVMCDIWRGTSRTELDPNDVSAWLGEWRALGVQRVVLSGGEALMHSGLWEICHALRDARIGISLLSTGLLLRRHAANIVRWCDEVIVSLDGPEAVHDRIRNVPRAFERLADGVAALRAAGGRVAVTGRCTVQRANYRSLRATVDTAHDIDLDQISFLAADVSSNAFNRPGGWDDARVEQVALDADQLAGLAHELDGLEQEHTDDFASGFIAEPPAKLRRRLLQYYAAVLGQGDFYPNECNAPWVSSVIESDGTVRPCFFQPALGNIHQAGGLNAVVNSPAAVAWRATLDVQRNPICRRCVCTLALGAAHTA